MNEIADKIFKLEEKLLEADVRANPELLEELLGDDFEEVGSTGQISNRREVIEWLVTKDRDVTWSLTDFRVKQLSPVLVLAIYRAIRNAASSDPHTAHSKGSLRSSIWQRSGEQWRMVFHQGTRVQDE